MWFGTPRKHNEWYRSIDMANNIFQQSKNGFYSKLNKWFIIWKIQWQNSFSSISSTSVPGGNQVDGLPLASSRDENEDFSKVMNSFFDLDQIGPIGRPCAHYTFNLICSRMILKFQQGAKKSSEGKIFLATKLSGGVKILLAAWAIDRG